MQERADLQDHYQPWLADRVGQRTVDAKGRGRPASPNDEDLQIGHRAFVQGCRGILAMMEDRLRGNTGHTKTDHGHQRQRKPERLTHFLADLTIVTSSHRRVGRQLAAGR